MWGNIFLLRLTELLWLLERGCGFLPLLLNYVGEPRFLWALTPRGDLNRALILRMRRMDFPLSRVIMFNHIHLWLNVKREPFTR